MSNFNRFINILSITGAFLLPASAALAQHEGHHGMHAMHAAEPTQVVEALDGLTLNSAWIRATPPNASAAAAYLSASNSSGTPLVFTGVSSTVAATSMFHSMVDEGGVMKMRHMAEWVVPAGGSAQLKPNSDHIMLMKLQQPMVAGQNVDLLLMLADGRALKLTLPVRNEAP